MTDLKDLSRDDCIDILVQDYHDERAFEVYDPMKGNALAIADYLNEFELYIFAGGPSLSHLGKFMIVFPYNYHYLLIHCNW